MNKESEAGGTVGKAMDVLDIVVSFGRAVRFQDVLEASSYPKATLHRLLQSLTSTGMLAYDEERSLYMPGMRLVRTGRHAWSQSSLASLARPFIEALAKDVGETVHLAQMENSRVIFIDKITPGKGFRTMASPGRLSPAHCTGVGKVMLAFMPEERRAAALERLTYEPFTPNTHTGPETLLPDLEQIRQAGVGYDRQEHEEGIMSVAAPIIGGAGQVIGAVSVVTSTFRMKAPDMEKFRPALSRTAAQIGSEAARWPYPQAQ